MTADPHEHGPGDQHQHEAGPWLDDARRILTLLETAGQQYAGATRGDEALAGECAWCPLCQALSVARRSAPELLDRFAELASGLAATIRATQPAASPGSPGAPGQAGQPGQAGPDPAPPDSRPGPPETVRIDITD